MYFSEFRLSCCTPEMKLPIMLLHEIKFCGKELREACKLYLGLGTSAALRNRGRERNITERKRLEWNAYGVN